MCDLLVLAPAVHGGGVRDSEWQLNKLVTEDQPRQPRGQEGLVSGLPATSTLQIKITPHMFPQPRDGEAKHRGVGEGDLDVCELGPELVTRDQEGHLQGGTGYSWSAGRHCSHLESGLVIRHLDPHSVQLLDLDGEPQPLHLAPVHAGLRGPHQVHQPAARYLSFKYFSSYKNIFFISAPHPAPVSTGSPSIL